MKSLFDFTQVFFFGKKNMGYPLLAAAAKSAASVGAGLGVAKAVFQRFRERMAAARGNKARRANLRGAKVQPSAGVRPWVIARPAFPASKNYHLVTTYDGTVVSSNTIGTYGTEDVFKPNSCFDPILGAATDQPIWWDQVAGLYNRYRVYAFTLEIRWYTENITECLQCASKVGNADDQVTLTGKVTKYVN